MIPRYDLKELEKLANTLKRVQAKKILKVAMKSGMIFYHSVIVNEFLSAPGRLPAPNPYKDRLRTDSGDLASDLRWKVVSRGKRIRGEIISSKEYMAIHEFGGTINFKKINRPPLQMPERAPIRTGIKRDRAKFGKIVSNVIIDKMTEIKGINKK